MAALALFSGPATAQAQSAEIRCNVTENGAPARGSLVAEQSGKRVGSGSCTTPLTVPPGKYRVTVNLDGALDHPSRTVEVEASAGKTVPVAVDFQTGVLEVRIETKGQRGTGLVTVNRGSKRVGTLGSGVAARLSVGSYEVVVKLDGREQRYPVDLRPGQRRTIRAQF
jgi:hypothetical protein